jgi:hypothetical protein
MFLAMMLLITQLSVMFLGVVLLIAQLRNDVADTQSVAMELRLCNTLGVCNIMQLEVLYNSTVSEFPNSNILHNF